MRWLLINYEYPPLGGGAANATYHIALQLLQLGHEVSVLTSAHAERVGFVSEDGVHVYRVPALRKHIERSSVLEMTCFVASGFFNLRSVVSERKIEACIAFFSIPCGPLALYLRLRHAIPYLVSLRGGDVPGNEPRLGWMHSLLTPLRRWVLRRAKAVVANSKGLREHALRADPGPVEVVPNGVDSAFFRPTETSDGAYVFLFVGRFSWEKNQELLLQTFAQLGARLSQPVRLMMVGGGVRERQLKALSQELGLSSVVSWHAWCSKTELLDYYQSAHCLLSPSFYEGMPNTVLEAMACGLPVVASRVSGQEELVMDGVSGYLYALEKPEDLLEACVRLASNPQHSRKLGLAGRDRVTQSYSWRATAGAYVDLLE